MHTWSPERSKAVDEADVEESQHTSAYVNTSAYLVAERSKAVDEADVEENHAHKALDYAPNQRQLHTPAYVSIRLHMSIMPTKLSTMPPISGNCIRQHTSACVCIRQHTLRIESCRQNSLL